MHTPSVTGSQALKPAQFWLLLHLPLARPLARLAVARNVLLGFRQATVAAHVAAINLVTAFAMVSIHASPMRKYFTEPY